MTPIRRAEFDAAKLVAEHPPKWRSRNKRALYALLAQPDSAIAGAIRYTRWREEPLPDRASGGSVFTIRPGVFMYNEPDGTEIHWYMNFADPRLFVAYSSDLLAQDELQVMEHPVLGSLSEALNGPEHYLETVTLDGRPTPITIAGVQRRLAIDTLPNPGGGRPGGLYGNAFARASAAAVVDATTVLSLPTVSNILAIAAPSYGVGRYTGEQIDYILAAAYTGYRAAREESADASARTVIHTGWWGCGAFGGNRTLMTMLQALAADLAGVDIIFHAFDGAGVAMAHDAYEQYQAYSQGAPSTTAMITCIRQQGFEWGVSDGN